MPIGRFGRKKLLKPSHFRILQHNIEKTVEPIKPDLVNFKKTFKAMEKNPGIDNFQKFLDVRRGLGSIWGYTYKNSSSLLLP